MWLRVLCLSFESRQLTDDPGRWPVICTGQRPHRLGNGRRIRLQRRVVVGFAAKEAGFVFWLLLVAERRRSPGALLDFVDLVIVQRGCAVVCKFRGQFSQVTKTARRI